MIVDVSYIGMDSAGFSSWVWRCVFSCDLLGNYVDEVTGWSSMSMHMNTTRSITVLPILQYTADRYFKLGAPFE